jgi:hypothetical protein
VAAVARSANSTSAGWFVPAIRTVHAYPGRLIAFDRLTQRYHLPQLRPDDFPLLVAGANLHPDLAKSIPSLVKRMASRASRTTALRQCAQ